MFWLIARAVKQRSGLPLLRTAPAQAKEPFPYLTVIVPARDEAGNIGRGGGLATVCHSIVEDLEFARLLKRGGHRVLMMDGTRSGPVYWKGRVYR